MYSCPAQRILPFDLLFETTKSLKLYTHLHFFCFCLSLLHMIVDISNTSCTTTKPLQLTKYCNPCIPNLSLEAACQKKGVRILALCPNVVVFEHFVWGLVLVYFHSVLTNNAIWLFEHSGQRCDDRDWRFWQIKVIVLLCRTGSQWKPWMKRISYMNLFFAPLAKLFFNLQALCFVQDQPWATGAATAAIPGFRQPQRVMLSWSWLISGYVFGFLRNTGRTAIPFVLTQLRYTHTHIRTTCYSENNGMSFRTR